MFDCVSYGSCDSCFTFFDEGEILFKVGEEYFCQKCLHKANKNELQIMCLAAEGKIHRIIDKDNISTLQKGIYTLNRINDYVVIDEDISSKEPIHIATYIDSDYGVLEKNERGCLLHFPKCLIIPKYQLEPDEESYTELYEIMRGIRCLRPRFVCDNQEVVGIVSGMGLNRQLKEFITRTPYYDTYLKAYFEELQSNPPIAFKVAEALQNITPADMLAYFTSRLIGQHLETKKIVYTFYEYLRNIANDKPFTVPSWILTAPSGCGKTEVFRILRDFFKEYKIPIPVVQIDLSHYTETGYKGKDATDILKYIVEANNKTDGTAICFLDEADKKFVPSIGSGTDGNAAFQASLLTIVEGVEQAVEVGSDKTEYTINTNKTMFIFMGAFQNIRDRKQEKFESRSTIGFGANIEKIERTNKVDDCFYEEITLDDMLEIGLLEELAGRIEQVINLKKLSLKDMKYLLMDKTKAISREFEIQIDLTAKAKREFLDICYSSLGIRRPINCIRTLVSNALAEVYFDEEFNKKSYHILITSPKKAVVCKNQENSVRHVFQRRI